MAFQNDQYGIGSEVARKSASRIRSLLNKGNFGAAHRVIEELERSLQYVPLVEFREIPIAELGLPERVTCALARNGIVYVKGLAGKEESYLRGISGVGPKAVNQIRQALQREASRRGE